MDKKQGWKGTRYQGKTGSQAATKAFNVKVELNYLNLEYDLEAPPQNNITEQGLLLVGRLMPKHPSLPQFLIRWDEKRDHLNVDMIPEGKYWTSETHGYKGHRPEKLKEHNGRAFSVVIHTPALDVVNCVISFNLRRDMTARATVGIHATAEATVTRRRNKKTP